MCQEATADGQVQSVEVYAQLSSDFSLSGLSVLVGQSHIEIVEKVRCYSLFYCFFFQFFCLLWFWAEEGLC